MFPRSKMFRVFSLVCLLLSLSAFVFADIIRLKDGSIIKGRIVRFENGKFTVLIDDGARQRSIDFSADEIASIVFESSPAPLPQTASGETSSDPNTKIITVGQTKPRDAATPKTSGGSTPVAAQPIRLRIPVLADETANGWTNSGWVVRKGQKIRISASGRIMIGNNSTTDAGGIVTLPDAGKLIKDRPTGSLIAVVGADNNEFIYIGESGEFTAARDGDLFLGINEGDLSDNSGAFDVIIEIYPNPDE